MLSKPWSDAVRRSYPGTLREAERIAGKPLAAFNQDDALRVKVEFEKLRNRSPTVKWMRLKSFFSWAIESKRLASDPTAGIVLEHRTDPEMPTIRQEDVERMLEYLKLRAGRNAAGSTHNSRDEAIRLWKVVYLLYRKGFRGGELIPTYENQPKTVCDCPGVECPRRPTPHDFKFVTAPGKDGRPVPTGEVLVRVKGEPLRIRFAQKFLKPEEGLWLREIIADPHWTLGTVNDRLKDLQSTLGIILVDRHGNPAMFVPEDQLTLPADKRVPIPMPLTTHSFRRTTTTALIRNKVPEPTINKVMGWTKNSHQSFRYGEQSPQDADAALADALKVRKPKKKEEVESTVAGAPEAEETAPSEDALQ